MSKKKAKPDRVIVQLGTRIPKELHRELNIYAVTSGESVGGLVVEALTSLLKRKKGTK